MQMVILGSSRHWLVDALRLSTLRQIPDAPAGESTPGGAGKPAVGRALCGRQGGEISFAEFDASVQGWINHVRHADTWGLRRHLLEPFVF